jgi:hypothetical protein
MSVWAHDRDARGNGSHHGGERVEMSPVVEVEGDPPRIELENP